MINKLLIMMISFSIIFSQQTHTFTDEEMVKLYTAIQNLEYSDSLNQNIIKNLNEQIYMYIQQTEIDSQIIANYIEQLKLKEDLIKEIKPKWHENKYLWFSMGIASVIIPIWGLGQLK